MMERRKPPTFWDSVGRTTLGVFLGMLAFAVVFWVANRVEPDRIYVPVNITYENDEGEPTNTYGNPWDAIEEENPWNEYE